MTYYQRKTPKKPTITPLTPLAHLKKEAHLLQIEGAEHLDFKELARQIALAKIRRGD